jgi:hypothetical protein
MTRGDPRQQPTHSAARAQSIATRISVGPQSSVPEAANENEFFNRRRVRVFVAIALAATVLAAGLALVLA